MDSPLVKLIIMFILLGLIMSFIRTVLRKWLSVEKKGFFSYGHVNKTHKKIDWSIRIFFLIFLVIGPFINIQQDPLDRIWFLETYNLLFGLIIVLELARIIMEKKYAENKNDYIFSMIQLGAIMIFILTLLTTDFFGLIKW